MPDTNPQNDNGSSDAVEQLLRQNGLHIEDGWRHPETRQEGFLIFDERQGRLLCGFHPDRAATVDAALAILRAQS